jgi:hypothetical protein
MPIGVDRAARLLGVSRLAFAVPLLVAPARMGRLWMGADHVWVRRLTRAAGVRDLVLGLALLQHRRARRPRLVASTAADLTDVVVSLGAAWALHGRRPLRGALIAASGAAAGATLVALDNRR